MVDRWLIRRKEGESLVHFAVRVGWHVGGAVFLYFGILLATALWWHREGVPTPIWFWLVVASVLCGIEGFLLTLLGNIALADFQWTDRNVRLTRPFRFLGKSFAAGVSIAAAEVIQIFIVAGPFWHKTYWELFLWVFAIGAAIFAVVLGVRAYEDIRFRPWAQIELYSE